MLKNREQKTLDEKISKLSVRTQETIKSAKSSFDKFCSEQYGDRKSEDIFRELKILKGSERVDALRNLLQDWIDWQYKNGNLTSSVHQYLSRIKWVFRHNSIVIHVEDFEEPLEFAKTVKEELHELKLDEIQKIFTIASPKKIGFYLALVSTGARPGELLQVRKKDIDTTQRRIKIRIEAENVKTRTGRSVWLTNEAARYLAMKLRGLNDSDLVWARNTNPADAERNEQNVFASYCDKVGLDQRYGSNNFRKITLYSFRSYFFGRAADVHREGYAHRMTGHGGYLPQYDRMSDEKRLDWFLKLESELTISDKERLKTENIRLKKEKEETENTKYEELKKGLEDLRLSIRIAREWDLIKEEVDPQRRKELAREFALKYKLNPDLPLDVDLVPASQEMEKFLFNEFSKSK